MRSTLPLALVLLRTSPILTAQTTLPTTHLNASNCESSAEAPQAAAVPAVHLVHRVNPQYPRKARRKKLEGDVTLDATIAKDGTVKDIKVRGGDPILADAAVEAAKQWRYDPVLVQGSAVEVQTTITVNFVLEGRGHFGTTASQEPAGPPADASTVPPTNDNAGEPGAVYKIGGDVKPPKPTYSPDPDYLESARKAKTKGTVTLELLVTPEGAVGDVEVCKSLEPSLDQRAVETVHRWKFSPATKDGKPVAVYVRVDLTFRLYQ
ncbi:MAG: energy transducer TonB [Terriglobales bacterium]